MKCRLAMKFKICSPEGKAAGFSLVELMIAMVVSGVVAVAAYTSYDIQHKSYAIQREAARMEANLRAAMFLLKNDIRNAGRSGEMTGKIGTNDIIAESRRYGACPGCASWSDTIDSNGYQGITLWTARDMGAGGVLGTLLDGEADYTDPTAYRQIQYRLWDSDNDGRRELHRFDSAAPAGSSTLVADGIDNIGFAFAYDDDDDGTLDRSAAAAGASAIIWAVDTDNTAGLDTNLDMDNSGSIEAADGAGVGLVPQIRMQKIRAVRIWILARSHRSYPGYVNQHTYKVGQVLFDPGAVAVANGDNTDHFRYMELSSSVYLRNHEQLD